jgi:CBS-domain-containing membrane protein
MKRNIVSIAGDKTIADAARLLSEKHIGTLPVIDGANRLIGLLPMRSLIEIVMPDFINLVENFDFVSDFGAAEQRLPNPEQLARPVNQIMMPPISVEESSGLLRVFAMLYQYRIHDLPVVDADGRLVGIVSRVDVGTAFLRNWNVTQGG